MGIFDALERPAARADVSWSALDDRHYGPVSRPTMAGYPVTAKTAMRVSTVFACTSLRAETLASLPCHLMRRLDNGDVEKARKHPLYNVARRQPNAQHTPMDFYALGETRICLHGLAVSEIQHRRAGVQLAPLDPQLTEVQELPDNRLRFQVRDRKGGPRRTLLQDEVHFVRDMMEDGIVGLARTTLAREAIAVAGAAEGFVAKYFANDASGRLVITHPSPLNAEKRKEFRDMVQENYGGWRNTRKAMLFTNGVKAEEIGQHDDARFLIDPRKYQVADIARFFGRIPLWLIGLEEKSTTWGTGIEQTKQAWIDFGMLPSILRHEQAMNRDLLLPDEQEEYFFAFNLDAILRGDLLTRSEANEIQRRNGALNANEWRAMENRNRRTDAAGEVYIDAPAGAQSKAPKPGNAAAPVDPNADDAANQDNQAPKKQPKQTPAPAGASVPAPLLADAAARIAARELRELQRHAGDPARLTAWVQTFYPAHAAYATKVTAPLVQSFCPGAGIAEDAARRICDLGAQMLGAGTVPAGWAERRADDIADILDETFTAAAALRRAAA